MPRKTGSKVANSGEWKVAFIAYLRKYPNVVKAANHVGVARSLVYRERAADPAFEAAFQDAWDEAIDAVEGVAMELARHRDPKNNSLRLAMLKAWKSERYGDKSQVTLKGSKEEPVEVHTQNDSTDRIAAILSVLADAGGLTPGASAAGHSEDDEVHAADDVGETGGVPPSI